MEQRGIGRPSARGIPVGGQRRFDLPGIFQGTRIGRLKHRTVAVLGGEPGQDRHSCGRTILQQRKRLLELVPPFDCACRIRRIRADRRLQGARNVAERSQPLLGIRRSGRLRGFAARMNRVDARRHCGGCRSLRRCGVVLFVWIVAKVVQLRCP